ncbi:MAG: lysine transporter LysE [Chloroflexi bacterium]|nr:MAG: lysine transporter LysE [Chloroflexota bacterium]
MILYFVQGATLGLSASASPGPFQAFLLAQTLKNGWQKTLPAAAAPLLSDGPIIFLVLLVLTQTPDWFLDGLRVAGGLFLFYLAWGAAQTALRPPDPTHLPVDAAHQSVLKGALMNALSPGPYIFWSILAGPILLEGWRQSPALGISFVAGFYLTLVGGFAAFVLVFAFARRFGPLASRLLSGVSAVALAAFGLYQCWTGIAGILGYPPLPI